LAVRTPRPVEGAREYARETVLSSECERAMEDATAPAASATTAQDTCFGAGSVAGAVIGTFLTTILLLTVAAFLYRQWRRRKSESCLSTC